MYLPIKINKITKIYSALENSSSDLRKIAPEISGFFYQIGRRDFMDFMYWYFISYQIVIVKLSFFKISPPLKGRVQKKKKIFMENSITGGGGVSEGHFPYTNFFIFFSPNGLKIIFRH